MSVAVSLQFDVLSQVGPPRRAGDSTNNLSQHNIRNTGFTQIRSSDIKQILMSWWCKFEHWFSGSVPAFINAENLRTGIKRRNDEIAFSISAREDFS